MTAELALARRAEAAGAAIIDREIAAHGKGQRSERLVRLHADMTHAVAVFGPCSPAHLGCLLALVREAWGIADATTVRSPLGWMVAKWWTIPEGLPVALCGRHDPTEAEALVAALEAAP